ncbi:hypothetical protein BGZ97_008170 [Linnemannia gamsii]|uniref:Uncharacterized protein n=1 Tax=Linnemannia gamsii TaxID=64522 RepID=A0A9P6RMX6_9FUNG|nr:hypothetical protein BGZ97_008170 [Linnemannia gamsii]
MSALSTASRQSLTLTRMGRALVLPTAPLSHLNRSFWSTTQGRGKKDAIKSAPMWNNENATESEADVKADRDPMPSNMNELQRESVEHIRSKHDGQKSGSRHDRQ